MISVRNLSKSFAEKKVLDRLSFDVRDGDIIAVLGPSGGGKTTLLRCLNFLEKAEEGTLVFDEKTYSFSGIRKSEIAKVRMRTGFVFQEFHLFANKTALENVMSGLTYARHQKKNEAKTLALEALKKVGMEGTEGMYPHQLSGGQKQRVAIARAMVTNPEILYFDEPTSALDPELTKEVLNVMKNLAAEGRTMLVVTHEMSFAKNVANRVLFMYESRIMEDAPAKEFFSNPKTDRAKEFLAGLSD